MGIWIIFSLLTVFVCVCHECSCWTYIYFHICFWMGHLMIAINSDKDKNELHRAYLVGQIKWVYLVQIVKYSTHKKRGITPLKCGTIHSTHTNTSEMKTDNFNWNQRRKLNLNECISHMKVDTVFINQWTILPPFLSLLVESRSK